MRRFPSLQYVLLFWQSQVWNNRARGGLDPVPASSLWEGKQVWILPQEIYQRCCCLPQCKLLIFSPEYFAVLLFYIAVNDLDTVPVESPYYFVMQNRNSAVEIYNEWTGTSSSNVNKILLCLFWHLFTNMLHSGVNIPNHDLIQSSEISIVKCNTLFNSCNNYLYRYEHDSILLKKRENTLWILCSCWYYFFLHRKLCHSLWSRGKNKSFALRLGIYSQEFSTDVHYLHIPE